MNGGRMMRAARHMSQSDRLTVPRRGASVPLGRTRPRRPHLSLLKYHCLWFMRVWRFSAIIKFFYFVWTFSNVCEVLPSGCSGRWSIWRWTAAVDTGPPGDNSGHKLQLQYSSHCVLGSDLSAENSVHLPTVIMAVTCWRNIPAQRTLELGGVCLQIDTTRKFPPNSSEPFYWSLGVLAPTAETPAESFTQTAGGPTGITWTWCYGLSLLARVIENFAQFS